jgi:transcriptional regulator with XRE-family HTH domain
MTEQIYRLTQACGGETELARKLHVTPRSVRGYQAGKFRPSAQVCRNLARVAAVLDGPTSPRADRQWWLDLDWQAAP